jgi:TDG/mug DNA glycosylase family protein
VDVIPDIVGPRPRVVFCGLACAESANVRDHYYANPTNNFWDMLHRSGLTPERLGPERETQVVDHGLGLTDVVRHISTTPPTWDVDDLVAKVERWQPEWLAFTAKGTAQGVARVLGARRPQLGPADWYIGESQVFVLPGTSGANQRKDYDGRPDRLSWWRTLAELLDGV